VSSTSIVWTACRIIARPTATPSYSRRRQQSCPDPRERFCRGDHRASCPRFGSPRRRMAEEGHRSRRNPVNASLPAHPTRIGVFPSYSPSFKIRDCESESMHPPAISVEVPDRGFEQAAPRSGNTFVFARRPCRRIEVPDIETGGWCKARKERIVYAACHHRKSPEDSARYRDPSRPSPSQTRPPLPRFSVRPRDRWYRPNASIMARSSRQLPPGHERPSLSASPRNNRPVREPSSDNGPVAASGPGKSMENRGFD